MPEQAPRENANKRYVSVILCYPEGKDRSHAQIIRFRFRDGSVWQVNSTRRGYWAAAQKAGGRGMLYPIVAAPMLFEYGGVPGREREFKLFNDDDEWFVEVEEPEEEG